MTCQKKYGASIKIEQYLHELGEAASPFERWAWVFSLHKLENLSKLVGFLLLKSIYSTRCLKLLSSIVFNR